MPDVIPEERIRAAYRARACAAGIACGAQIFSVGAGLLIPVCLNAAYLAALPALIPCAITAFCARRHLASGKSAGRQPIGKALLILLSLMLLFCCASLLCAAVVFTQQTLLPQAHLTTCLMLTLCAAFLCALPTGTGVSRLAFALRFPLPCALLLFAVLSLSPDSPTGFFPLLGSGVKPLMLGMLCGLSSCAPALILFLPPEELTKSCAPPAAVPNAGFFVGRVLAGGLVGVLMLLALSLCEPYELLSEQSVWGMRMMILSSSRPREGIIPNAAGHRAAVCAADWRGEPALHGGAEPENRIPAPAPKPAALCAGSAGIAPSVRRMGNGMGAVCVAVPADSAGHFLAAFRKDVKQPCQGASVCSYRCCFSA